MGIDMKPYIQKLQGRETISLPELQLLMGCTYVQAREAMQNLRRSGLVSSTVRGVDSAINVQLCDRRGMTLEQVRTLVSDMTTMEIMTLDIIQDALQRGGYSYEPQPEDDEELKNCLDSLAQKQLIHEFEGLLFPSINNETWKLIRKIDKSRIDEPAIIILAIPILERAFALKDEPIFCYELCLIPETCKEFIRNSFAEFESSGVKPEQLAQKLGALSEYKNLLALDMLHAVLAANPELESTSSYVRAARMSARRMRGHDLWDDVVYDAADEAIKMISELSIEDIRSVQSSQNDEDDEDDDW